MLRVSRREGFYLEDIGHRIRYLRNSRKLSMTKLGNAIGVSSGNISDWETGRSKPTIAGLIALSDYFGVPIDWIVKGTGPGPGEVPVREKRQAELSPLEREILEKFRELDEEGKREVAHFVNYTHFEQAKKGRLSTSTSEQAAGKEYA